MAKLPKIGDFFKKKSQEESKDKDTRPSSSTGETGNTNTALVVSERTDPIHRPVIRKRDKRQSQENSSKALIPYQDYTEVGDTKRNLPEQNTFFKEGEIDDAYREKVYTDWENREKVGNDFDDKGEPLDYPYEPADYPYEETKEDYPYEDVQPDFPYEPAQKVEGAPTSSYPSTPEVKSAKELLDKNTQYIFVFGYNGSGKSTLLAALNHYLQKHYNTIENHENPSGIRELNRLVRKIRRGKFPDQTPAGTLLEYDVSVVVDDNNMINLTFLEMAGEDLRGVSIMNEDRDLPEFIKPYLTTPDLPISFVLVADYDQIVNPIADDAYQDDLMQNFLDMLVHLDTDTHNVALVISKYDQEKIEEGETLQRVMEDEMYRTYNKLLDESRIPNGRVFPFSVGSVGTDPESGEDIIEELNLDDCKKILTWLIGGFDVKRTGKPTLRKMLDRLGV